MAAAMKVQILLFCWTSVLPLLSTAHTQTTPGSKSTAQISQLDTSSEQLQFIKNLRHVLKEEYAVQDSGEKNLGIENIPDNLGHETPNRKESLKNLDARPTDPTSYFSDAIQEAEAEKQEIDDQFPWKLAENDVPHIMRTPVISPFNKYRRKYKMLRRVYNRFLRGGNSRYKRKYFSTFKTFRRKYNKLLHKLHYPKMSRGKFKISLKYYTLLNKFYILKRLVGKSRRKLKTLMKILSKPNGKETAKKLARKYVSKYRKLKTLYRLLLMKYAKLLRKVRFLRKHPLVVLPKSCKTLLSFFYTMKKVLKRHHNGGRFDVKHNILKQLRKKLQVIKLYHPRTALCLRLILKKIPPTVMPKGTMTPPTKATVLPSIQSTTPMPKSTIMPTRTTVLPSKTPSTTPMLKSTIMPTRTTVLPSKTPSTTSMSKSTMTPPTKATVLPSKTPSTTLMTKSTIMPTRMTVLPKKTPKPDPKVLGVLKVTVPPSTRTIPSPTRATPSPTRTTAIRTRSSAPRTGATPTPTRFTESTMQQIWNKILNS